MKRVLEQELMHGRKQVIAYARANFSASNQLFVDSLARDYPNLRKAIDLGCGPADVLIRLAKANPKMSIVGVDGSARMVQVATVRIIAAGMANQIQIVFGRIQGLKLGTDDFDAICSKDLLHHLESGRVLWDEIKCIGKPGTVVYVMDLFRPRTLADAKMIVKKNAAHEHPLLKEDFLNSLRAAFTLDEVKRQLARAGLQLEASIISERHMLIKGKL